MSAARDTPSEDETTAAIPLVSAGNSDRCASCGAQLAVDQRYCVECGTRRGAPRFQLSGQGGGLAEAARAAPAPRPGLMTRIARPGASGALLIGLFILLLALGIGVLIGHNGNSKQSRQPINVVANFSSGSGASSGSSSGSAASTTASATSGSSGASSSTSKTKSKKTASKSASTKAASKAATSANASASGKSGTAAAAKSFGSSAGDKSTVGGKCSAGTPGCSASGSQTGNVFGG